MKWPMITCSMTTQTISLENSKRSGKALERTIKWSITPNPRLTPNKSSSNKWNLSTNKLISKPPRQSVAMAANATQPRNLTHWWLKAKLLRRNGKRRWLPSRLSKRKRLKWRWKMKHSQKSNRKSKSRRRPLRKYRLLSKLKLNLNKNNSRKKKLRLKPNKRPYLTLRWTSKWNLRLPRKLLKQLRILPMRLKEKLKSSLMDSKLATPSKIQSNQLDTNSFRFLVMLLLLN